MIDAKNKIEIFGFQIKITDKLKESIDEAKRLATGIDFDVIIVDPNGTITEPRVSITCFSTSIRLILESFVEEFLEIILADLDFKDRQLVYSANWTFKADEGQLTQQSPVA